MKGTLLVVSAVTVLLYPGPDRWGLFEIQAFLDKVVREDVSPQDQWEAAMHKWGS